MSEIAYAAAAANAYEKMSKSDGSDDTGLCCRNCSPFTRKVGYYITFAFGIFVFAIGIITMLGFSPYFLVVGSTIILLSPLWIRSPCDLYKEFKNPLRLTSLIIFLIFFGLSIVCMLFELKLLAIIAGFGLAISGIWYFLSYFKNGQKACLTCLSTCFKQNESQGTENTEGMVN